MKMMISKMRSTASSGLLGNGMEAEMYSGFLDDAISTEMAKGGGVGISKMLYTKMSDALLRRLAAENMRGTKAAEKTEDSK